MGMVSEVLAMDRTTVTANLKPLERRGLVRIAVDPSDRRSRRLSLTPAGLQLLAQALPLWDRTQDEIRQRMSGIDLERLCKDLHRLS